MGRMMIFIREDEKEVKNPTQAKETRVGHSAGDRISRRLLRRDGGLPSKSGVTTIRAACRWPRLASDPGVTGGKTASTVPDAIVVIPYGNQVPVEPTDGPAHLDRIEDSTHVYLFGVETLRTREVLSRAKIDPLLQGRQGVLCPLLRAQLRWRRRGWGRRVVCAVNRNHAFELVDATARRIEAASGTGLKIVQFIQELLKGLRNRWVRDLGRPILQMKDELGIRGRLMLRKPRFDPHPAPCCGFGLCRMASANHDHAQTALKQVEVVIDPSVAA